MGTDGDGASSRLFSETVSKNLQYTIHVSKNVYLRKRKQSINVLRIILTFQKCTRIHIDRKVCDIRRIGKSFVNGKITVNSPL